MTRAPSPWRELLFIRISVSIDQWPPRAFCKDVRNHRRGYYDVFMKYRGRTVSRKCLLSEDVLLFTMIGYGIQSIFNCTRFKTHSFYLVIKNFIWESQLNAQKYTIFLFFFIKKKKHFQCLISIIKLYHILYFNKILLEKIVSFFII